MSIADEMGMKDPNEPRVQWTPETLEAAAKRCDQLRLDLLFDIEESGADAESTAHFIIAVSLLEQAKQHLQIACLLQRRAEKR